MGIVTRFAPSPTGYLHLGHVWSAFVNWQAARSACGVFLVRIEDIDRSRCRPEFDRAIVEDLHWLGLDPDGEIRRQGSQLVHYQRVLQELRERGLLYPCFCTRKQILEEVMSSSGAPHGPLGIRYPGTCRRLAVSERDDRIASGENHAWRLDVAEAARRTGPMFWCETSSGRDVVPVDPFIGGDVVLARKDFATSYHLAVTHDDHVQGITLVSRGLDLLPSTNVHRLLQELMGWHVPDYAHHVLLRNCDGTRFSKRDKSITIRELRNEGQTADNVIARARTLAETSR